MTTAFLVRALLSGVIVATVALLARRSPAMGALVASLPLVSLLGMIWLWRDTHDRVRVADHAEATLWYVVPSLPMFLLIPRLIRGGSSVPAAILAGCALTVALYLTTVAVASRFGIRF